MRRRQRARYSLRREAQQHALVKASTHNALVAQVHEHAVDGRLGHLRGHNKQPRRRKRYRAADERTTLINLGSSSGSPISKYTRKGATRLSATSYPPSARFVDSARTNCGECGSEPVTNGQPRSGPIKLSTPRIANDEW
eukprot:1942020-Prymnesium_polylepis.1